MLQSTTVPTIFISNFIAMLLAITMLVANNWRWRRGEKENSLLVRMLILLSIVCITEPTAFIIEARPGILFRVLLYACNTYTYGAHLIVAASWLMFIIHHIVGEISFKKALIIRIPVAVGLFALLVNLFVPVVFSIDSANCYHRLTSYYAYLVVEFIMFFASFVLYLWAKITGQRQRFFVFWVYMLPVVAVRYRRRCSMAFP